MLSFLLMRTLFFQAHTFFIFLHLVFFVSNAQQMHFTSAFLSQVHTFLHVFDFVINAQGEHMSPKSLTSIQTQIALAHFLLLSIVLHDQHMLSTFLSQLHPASVHLLSSLFLLSVDHVSQILPSRTQPATWQLFLLASA